jgi:DeoR family glycerol-3-phosphate regulon repressor
MSCEAVGFVNDELWHFLLFCPPPLGGAWNLERISSQAVTFRGFDARSPGAGRAMNHSKRHGEILKLLQEEGTITIASLADRLGVSLETVRRDVKPLTGNGTVLKMHGAIGLPSMVGEAPFERRMREHAEAKRAIARLVAATIGDGESVMLDTGTTTSFLARELLGHRRLTVVTNSSDIARTLATVNGNKVYMAGGELRSDSGAAFGVSAIDFVSRFSVDHVVISAGAVNATMGVMDYVLEEAEFARVLLERGPRSIVVTDHSKFGRQGLVQVCGLDGFTELATEAPPPADIAAALESVGTKVLIANG